ncbi:hypothetical protein [Streptomyces neyagawaensis]|uniref:hypothetical protein n=1 Tax=Streptomyces neyagawaensis TaxID=42238 RepID=UPI0006E252FD|nr:hypothetical protein [Streptomyces neyagawaensis]MCL6735988.1 hypothetical protein [Streptomyces neyagawaensis]MDE1686906.1 hypothetical protein [Streptomyces neyagawaensis]
MVTTASASRSTSLIRKRYAVLLAGSAVVAFVLRAVRDALALRALRRRTDRRANRRLPTTLVVPMTPVAPARPIAPAGPPTTVPPPSPMGSPTDVAARRPGPALVSR